MQAALAGEGLCGTNRKTPIPTPKFQPHLPTGGCQLHTQSRAKTANLLSIAFTKNTGPDDMSSSGALGAITAASPAEQLLKWPSPLQWGQVFRLELGSLIEGCICCIRSRFISFIEVVHHFHCSSKAFNVLEIRIFRTCIKELVSSFIHSSNFIFSSNFISSSHNIFVKVGITSSVGAKSVAAGAVASFPTSAPLS
nr:hypothetical protein Iba_chr06bCG16780 [Ipomoea batatas]